MEKNKIYLLDVIEYLNKLENNSIDLAIIDPPYNLDIDYWDNFSSFEEFLNFTNTYLNLVYEKLKETGSLYIFNTAYNSVFIFDILKNKLNMNYLNWIIWYKKDGFSACSKKYVNNQETILFFTKSKNYTFNCNDIRIPYASTDRINAAQKNGILKNGKRWFPNPNGKLCTDVWEFPSVRLSNKVNGKTVKQKHPTPKPELLIERMIKASSNKGDLVLDLFSGTGTTAVVAKKNDRLFTGCENNTEYLEFINNRLKEN